MTYLFYSLLFATFVLSMPAWALVNGVVLKNTVDLVRLEFHKKDAVCTGFFINPTTIMTSAHCLYSYEPGILWAPMDVEVVGELDRLDIAIKALVPHPQYQGSETEYDIGLIRTSRYERFIGSFVPEDSGTERTGAIEVFGAGKVDLKDGIYGRSSGTNFYFKLGSLFYFFGISRNSDSPGIRVTVAPNDSGGPIVSTDTKKVVAISSKTTLGWTYGSFLPSLSIATSLTKENMDFIRITTATENKP